MADLKAIETQIGYGTFTPVAACDSPGGARPCICRVPADAGGNVLLCYSVSDSTASDTCAYECNNYYVAATPVTSCP